ncbi:hypothetical protein SUGI_1151490 [Cryptomeria japonica]|nr:hypothetical protein SUGI_1151490 [Cryptomeria japonica]
MKQTDKKRAYKLQSAKGLYKYFIKNFQTPQPLIWKDFLMALFWWENLHTWKQASCCGALPGPDGRIFPNSSYEIEVKEFESQSSEEEEWNTDLDDSESELKEKKKLGQRDKRSRDSPVSATNYDSMPSYHVMPDKSVPVTNRTERTPFPKDLNVNSPYLNLGRENLDDVLAIAHDSLVNYFKMQNWVFNEIKEINVKLYAISNK